MSVQRVGYCLLAAVCLLCLSGCGEKEHRHETVYLAEHSPTCTEDGLAGHWMCVTCGATFSDEAGKYPAPPEVLPALGHNLASEEVTSATCEEAGLTRHTCLRCGYEEEEIIPATGHLFGSWECVLSPKCETAGEESRSCAWCGTSETRPSDPLGHEYSEDNVCIRCGKQLLASPGLAYAPVTGADGNFKGYSVSLGTATASEIVVAPYYEGMPVLSVEAAGFQNSSITRFVSYAELETIGEDAFRGCTALLSIDLPDSVVSVGDGAFYGCSAAETLSVGSSLGEVGRAAFFNLQSLEVIEVSKDNAVYAGDGSCLIERETGKLLLGCASSVIPDYITEIADFAFFNNEGLSEAVLPAGVSRIGLGAFYGCISLTEFSYLGSEEAWEGVEKGKEWKEFAAFQDVRFGG